MTSRTILHRTGPRARRALAVAAIAVGLAGCGAASAPKPAGTTPPALPGDAASAGPAASSGAGSAAHAIDVCAVLPVATAAKLSGLAVTTGAALTYLQPQEYGCGYSNGDSSVQMEVTVFEHDAANSYALFSSSPKDTVVRGLGDGAVFDNDATMYVLAGDNLIQVNGVKTADGCAALARVVLAVL